VTASGTVEHHHFERFYVRAHALGYEGCGDMVLVAQRVGERDVHARGVCFQASGEILRRLDRRIGAHAECDGIGADLGESRDIGMIQAALAGEVICE
jgi:hypothetical protein